jgi:hypothetical protein
MFVVIGWSFCIGMAMDHLTRKLINFFIFFIKITMVGRSKKVGNLRVA